MFGSAAGGELIARITIMPYGDAAGHVQQLDKDDFMPREEELLNRICVCLGGRVAQQVIMGRSDVGASNDFQQARTMAYRMVADFGFSKLGAIPAIEGVERSEKEKAAIEAEVDAIIAECESRVREIITKNQHRINAIVAALMKKETILGPEFKEIWESATVDSAPVLPPLLTEAGSIDDQLVASVEFVENIGPGSAETTSLGRSRRRILPDVRDIGHGARQLLGRRRRTQEQECPA